MESDPGFLALRIFGMIFLLIGSLGMLSVSIGIYSMVGYAVSRQTREIGVHMALGAQKSDLLRLVIGRSMRPIEVRIIAGIALDVALSMFLSSLFQGLRLLDPA